MTPDSIVRQWCAEDCRGSKRSRGVMTLGQDVPILLALRHADRAQSERAERRAELLADLWYGVRLLILFAVLVAAVLGGWCLCAPVAKQIQPPPKVEHRQVWMPSNWKGRP